MCALYGVPRVRIPPSPPPRFSLGLQTGRLEAAVVRYSLEKAESGTVNDSELKYWVALQSIPGIGPVNFAALERGFDSFADAWTASKGGLIASGVDSRAASAVVSGRAHVGPDRRVGPSEKRGHKGCHRPRRRVPATPQTDSRSPATAVR